MLIKNRPVFTDTFEALEKFTPDANSSYIYGSSPEERSEHSNQWEKSCVGVKFVSLTNQGPESFSYEHDDTTKSVRLRSSRDQQDFWRSLTHRKVYLDITALEHQVWAALLKSALAVGLRVFVLYSEPGAYTFSRSPREGDIFDLSERITGLAPLPGFASLSEARQEDEVTFVALLGFEGIRLKYCVEQVQPPRNRIVPIIGVPGFQAEYPFYTYDGNRTALDETGAWQYARFAKANCPFSLFYLLEDVAAAHTYDVIKIAMIGTKPHALGAVLFALLSPRSVELIYDHPIRKPFRTEGKGRTLLYNISAMSSPAVG
jgi:hypothetical protein